MKVGIVGAGLVGSTAAYAMLMKGVGREIVLVDAHPERSRAEADDLFHAVPFAHPLEIIAGDYPDLRDTGVVVVAAGVAQRPGETRCDLLQRNAAVFAQVIPSVLDASPHAVIVIATNPVDIMTHIAAVYAEKHRADPTRVLGTGTTLDTARFRSLIARKVGIDAQHVHGYVLGEHGDSEVLAWSTTTVAGIPIDTFCDARGIRLDTRDREAIDDAVRNAAYRIIEGKGSTYYGVGSAIARIVDTVLSDRRSILTVCCPDSDVAGVSSTTVSLPRLVGGDGVMDTFMPSLTEDEYAALSASARVVTEAIAELGDL